MSDFEKIIITWALSLFGIGLGFFIRYWFVERKQLNAEEQKINQRITPWRKNGIY